MSVEKLAFDELGSGPAVVLVHGHPFDRRMWSEQLEPLAAAGFRVIAPDLRGYGRSPATPGTVPMSELAGDVAALVGGLGVDSAAVVGLSMGGLVAMELATGGMNAWALGLIATTAAPVTPEERAQRLALADRIETEGISPAVAAMADRLYGPACPAAVKEAIDAMMRANNPLGSAAALRGRAQRPDYRPRLRSLRIPAFVCAGTADTWSTAAVTEEIVSCLRSPEVLLLPDVGHLPNLERIEAFNSALTGFLRRASAGRQRRV